MLFPTRFAHPLARTNWRSDASATSHPENHGVHPLPAVRAGRAHRPHLAERGHRQGAAVVLGRPARRQPGAHRPDGPDPQAADVRGTGRDGLQGDRGRLPVGQPTRLRLRPPADRGGPDPRRRHDPGAHPVPPGADRAHVRVPAGCTAGDRPLLQLDQPAAARGRVRPRQARDRRRRGQRRQAVPQVGARAGRHGRALRVLTRELHAHRARLRDRDLRGGDGRGRADTRPADHPQPAGDGRVLLPQRVRRRDRVVRPHDQAARLRRRHRCTRTTTAAAPSPPPSSA